MDKGFLALAAALSALTFGGAWVASAPAVATAGTEPPPSIASPVAAAASAMVHYPGCDAVRAAGKAPLYVGDPGYRSGMDGDHDGIACEPYHGGSGFLSYGGGRRRRH